MSVKVSSKGWVVIPVEIRKKYHLSPGTEVQFIDYGGVLAMAPALEDPIQSSQGLLAEGGRSLTEALLEDHRKELEDE